MLTAGEAVARHPPNLVLIGMQLPQAEEAPGFRRKVTDLGPASRSEPSLSHTHTHQLFQDQELEEEEEQSQDSAVAPMRNWLVKVVCPYLSTLE